MARTLLVTVLALVGFMAAFAVTGEQMGPAPVPVAGSDGPPTHESTVPAAPPARLNATASPPLPLLRIRKRQPTAFETIVLERPQDFYAMMRPLQRALQADKHLTRLCFADSDLPGKVTVEFSWTVASTAEHARASDLRFVQVHDGVALPGSVLVCIQQTLDGTYEALADSHAFPAFAGEIPIRLSWLPESQRPPSGAATR